MRGNRIFVDTCLVIEYLKDNIELDKSNCYINNIVLMELYIGAKNKQDLGEIKAKLQGFKILEIDQNIMDLSTQIIEYFRYIPNLEIVNITNKSVFLSG